MANAYNSNQSRTSQPTVNLLDSPVHRSTKNKSRKPVQDKGTIMKTAVISAETPTNQKLSQREEVAETLNYAKVFDTGVSPQKIAAIEVFASRSVVRGNERQARMLEALKECVASAKSGKPMRLSPEMHQLNVLNFAANLCEGILIHAECEGEEASAILRALA